MVSKKKPTNSTNPDKSGSNSQAKNGSGNDDKNEKEKRGKHNLQQLPTEAEPVLLEPIMKLPTEIRQMVCDFALTEDQQPVLVERWNVNIPYTRPLLMKLPKLSTGLMGVCHKIREEGGQRYYILNEFRFFQPSTLIDWLRDPNRRNQLRSIACRLDANDTWFGKSSQHTKQKYKLEDAGKDNYISVDEFFESEHAVESNPRGKYPVINYRSRGDPKYVPAEACTIEPGQLAKLTPIQTEAMIRFAVRNPSLNAASIKSKCLSALGLFPAAPKITQLRTTITPDMITVCGRMLDLPSVLYKNDETPMQAPGGWNVRGVNFKSSVPNFTDGKLEKWGCLRLSDNSSRFPPGTYESAISKFQQILRRCGITTGTPRQWTLNYDKGLDDFFDTNGRMTIEGMVRVAHQERLKIVLIVLPDKNTALYNRIKRSSDLIEGIHTVCVVGKGDKNGNGEKFYKINDTYFANVALKFNLKLGGTNHILNDVDMGIISRGKTMVVGIDVVHPSPGSEKASVASMVANINKDLAQWPVDLRVQIRKGKEMLDKAYVMLETRLALWKRHHDAYPENILVYRDGVSESQYQQVLNEELKAMQDGCQSLYRASRQEKPRFTLIVVGKRHHTRFYPPTNHPDSDDHGNPKRGLVVDRGITEARNWDFFLQSHNALQGTARPVHYYVLWDEIFTHAKLKSVRPGIRPADNLERLTYSMCYLFSRAAKAVSVPAPVYYADVACERAGRYLAEIPTSSESAWTDSTKMTDGQRDQLRYEMQQKIEVHEDLKDSMFYI